MARETGTPDSLLDRRSYLRLAGTAAATIASTTAVTSTVTATEQLVETSGCFDSDKPLSREEERVFESVTDDAPPVADQILVQSDFDTVVTEFKAALCDTSSVEAAYTVVTEYGTRLWDLAVARAQGHEPSILESDSTSPLHRYDDRPLYWARLQMAILLRRWNPSFAVRDTERNALLTRLEHASRGITSAAFASDSDTNILFTGFDPFGLDSELRSSNPSGMAALQLDGRRLDTKQGEATVQAMTFPVRWQAFDDGIVEDAIGPHLVADSPSLDAVVTCSQGSSDKMEIEGWAGGWREGGAGVANNATTRNGPIPPATDWPQPTTQPDWIGTTLPVTPMVTADTGPSPTVVETNVTEWSVPHEGPDPRRKPVDHDRLADREGGPTIDGRAFAGSGGNFMSNASMYRANRLRLAVGKDELPSGHLHTPYVQFPLDRDTDLTPTTWEDEVTATTDQVVALVTAVADAIQNGYRVCSSAKKTTCRKHSLESA